MSATMPEPKRNIAIERLRVCAEKVLKIRRDRTEGSPIKWVIGRGGRRRDQYQLWLEKLEAAWRSFPECERDPVVPSAEEILAEVHRLDREAEENRKFEESFQQ